MDSSNYISVYFQPGAFPAEFPELLFSGLCKYFQACSILIGQLPVS